MSKQLSGSAISRHQVFVLGDGEPVVQWTDSEVQELLSGRYRRYDHGQFGHPITDYELNQLKEAGRVEQYNRQFVWLFALPESHRFGLRTMDGSEGRMRAFYLNTTMIPDQLETVRSSLAGLTPAGLFTALEHSGTVVVTGTDGKMFANIADAEAAQRRLIAHAPNLFGDSVIAFLDVSARSTLTLGKVEPPQDEAPVVSLDALVATQEIRALGSDTDRSCVIITTDDDEMAAIVDVLKELQIFPFEADSAETALRLIEDTKPDLVIMSVRQHDMHGWQMIARMREMRDLGDVAIIVLGDATDEDPALAAAAGIDEFIVQPVTPQRLRQSIWMAIKRRSHSS